MPSIIARSSIEPQEQSPLLRLQGELRNKIYTYALKNCSKRETVMLPRDVDKPHSACHLYTRGSDGGWYEINQLKYVCKQLYLETRSIGLDKYTKLTFPTWKIYYNDPWEYNPGLGFLRFLEDCRVEYIRKTLKWVVIVFLPPILGFPNPSQPKSRGWYVEDSLEMRQYMDEKIREEMERLCAWYSELKVEFNPGGEDMTADSELEDEDEADEAGGDEGDETDGDEAVDDEALAEEDEAYDGKDILTIKICQSWVDRRVPSGNVPVAQ